jgi:hypothetical protein
LVCCTRYSGVALGTAFDTVLGVVFKATLGIVLGTAFVVVVVVVLGVVLGTALVDWTRCIWSAV